jgi:DeoR/GlpR family transcriptional regulator of sugar metabolism
VIALSTAAKLGSAGPNRVAALHRIDTLVTDAPEDELVVVRELGIEVVAA